MRWLSFVIGGTPNRKIRFHLVRLVLFIHGVFQPGELPSAPARPRGMRNEENMARVFLVAARWRASWNNLGDCIAVHGRSSRWISGRIYHGSFRAASIFLWRLHTLPRSRRRHVSAGEAEMKLIKEFRFVYARL